MASTFGPWVFYYLQDEDGEDRSHPNAYRLKCSDDEAAVKTAFKKQIVFLHQILESFPFPSHLFHFRFRLDQPKLSTFFWLDVKNPQARVPLVQGKVMIKVLRRNRPQKVGHVIRLYPRKNKTKSNNSTYNDDVNQRTTTATTTTAARRRNSASLSPSKLRRSTPPPAPAPPASSDQSLNEFLNSPPSSSASSSSSKSSIAAVPVPVKKKQQPTFKEGGQTVGPVTLAEMSSVGAATSDGTQVYNPKLVDKSTKSAEVKRAMEAREASAQASADVAKEELRARESASLEMERGKAQAIERLGPVLKAWAEDNGRKKNIRTLLSTMHTVMWPGCKWKEAGMAKLLNPLEVKKSYRRAMLVVHPDKNSGRTAEQVLIAERVFDAVNCAWEEFAAKEMPN